MRLDKMTLMLFGGGLLAGYLICKFTSKSVAPVGFSADGLMRAEIGTKPHIGATPSGSNSTPTPMGGVNPIGYTGNLSISRRRN